MNSTQDKKRLITKQQQQTHHKAKAAKAKIIPVGYYRIRGYLFSEVLSAFRFGIQSVSQFV